MRMLRSWRRGALYGLLSLLAACNDCPDPPPLSCLPSPPPGPADSPSSHAEHGPVAIYIDASLSMLGYVRNGPGKSLYQDLVLSLPDLVSIGPLAPDRGADYAMFGTEVRSIDRKGFVAAVNPGFYHNDINTWSHIDEPLNAADSVGEGEDAAEVTTGHGLKVIITDLFLSADDIGGSGTGLLGPFAKLLRAGQAVGLLGVASAFNGKIYDLPSSGAPIDYRGKRPFYVLLVGAPASVVSFYRSLEKLVLDQWDGAEYHFLLFTVDLVDPVETTARQGLQLRPGEGTRVRPGLVQDGFDLLQLEVRKGSTASRLYLPLAAVADEFRPKPGRPELEQRLYRFRPLPNGCPWKEIDPRRPLVELTHWQTGQAQLNLFPEPILSRSLPHGLYLMDLELVNTAPTWEGPSYAWLKDWSFRLRDEAALRQAPPPALFPTLNLQILGEAMFDVLRELYREETLGRTRVAFCIH